MDYPEPIKPKQPENLFRSMFNEPRKTVRFLIDNDPTHHVKLLAILAGITGMLGRYDRYTNDFGASFLVFMLLVITLGPIFGILQLYIAAEVLRIAGSFLKENAYSEDIRTAMAWGSIPGLVLLTPFTLGFILLDGVGNPESGMYSIILGLLFIFQILLGIFTATVYYRSIGEAFQVSAWRAFAISLMPLMALVFIVLACAGLVRLVT